MTILITGNTGLLGSAFARLLPDATIASRADVVRNVEAWRQRLLSGAIDVVLNCIAHTNVEEAETDPAPNLALNAELPGTIADACAATGAVLAHFSSTGCYGAWKADPYVETDALKPTTAHHRAKAVGEDRVRRSGCSHAIFRLGWLYGGSPAQRKNFVWKRLLEARENDVVHSDDVQRGCPSHVDEVAANVLEVIDAGERGTFNLVAHGTASRYDYVNAIVRHAGLDCRVKPGPAFARRATVSSNEAAANEALQRISLDRMRPWEVGLADYVQGLTRADEWSAIGGGNAAAPDRAGGNLISEV